MTTRYLLHFVHEHIPFRWPEFTALAAKHGLDFQLISPEKHITTRPFILIQLNSDNAVHKLIQSVQDSYLLRSVIELWAQSSTSLEDLAAKVSQTTYCQDKRFTDSSQCFRVDVDSFGCKVLQSTKIDWIRKMIFLEKFDSKPNLTKPQITYSICAMHESNPTSDTCETRLTDCYFGRVLSVGDRSSVKKFSLKTRKFIANTSMDPLLGLITSNVAKIGQNDFVYDPFVGSGGLLLAAAHKGAYTFGADIDWLLLHGKSRPSRIGQKLRLADENVRANFQQYNMTSRYVDVLVSDISKSPWNHNTVLDAVIADPPYGVRESSAKIGSKRPRQVREGILRFPAKISYTMDELLSDLLSFSARHLKLGGRLAYYQPVVIASELTSNFDDFIPRHPCLRLLSHSEQKMAVNNYRILVVMEKTRDPQPDDKIEIPSSISDNNFRDVYFSRSHEPDLF